MVGYLRMQCVIYYACLFIIVYYIYWKTIKHSRILQYFNRNRMRLRRPVDVHTSLSIYNIKYRDYKKNTFIGYLYIYTYTRACVYYMWHYLRVRRGGIAVCLCSSPAKRINITVRVRESESVYECVRVARVLARSRASRNMSTTSLKHKEITRFVAVGSRSRGRASACVCVCMCVYSIDGGDGDGGVPAESEERRRGTKLQTFFIKLFT